MNIIPTYYPPNFSEDKFKNAPNASYVAVDMDGVAPDNFHSTSMLPDVWIITIFPAKKR